jgi:hypothetical protein
MSLKRSVVSVLLVALMVGLSANIEAHHGWSGYDSGQTLNLTGEIQVAGYEHPHAYIKLEAPGKVWLVVLAPPSRMGRRGIPREVLVVGTTATVIGYPHRTDPDEMRAERITIGDKAAELR